MAKRNKKRCVYFTKTAGVQSVSSSPTWAQAQGRCKKITKRTGRRCEVVQRCFRVKLVRQRKGVYRLVFIAAK